MNKQTDSVPDGSVSAPDSGSETLCVSSEALLSPAGRLLIRHRGELYTLRLTRQGRLILNK